MKKERRPRQPPSPAPPASAPQRPRIEAVIVFAVAILANASSLGNRYALDDQIIILGNVYVQKGIAGIGDLLTHDAYHWFYESAGTSSPLSGGRYRPLSAVTFAVEQSLFGETLGGEYERLRDEARSLGPAHARAAELREAMRELLDERIVDANLAIAAHRHAIQLLLFASSMIALLAFLRLALPSHPEVAFVATLLFAIHPLHTEVVANIKSRDEILSLLFIALSGIALFRHDRTRAPRDMGLAALFLFLALLSKEYAVFALVVLGAAVALARKRRPGELLRAWVPLIAVVIAFLAIRFAVLGKTPGLDASTQDVLNDPYLPLRLGTATGSILASKLSVLPHYVRLLLVPHPLSYDYSYATWPFATFASPRVLLSLALYGAIVAGTLFAWRRRHPLAVAGIAYLAFLLPVSNVLFEIGATMGERLVYHASLGFVLLLAWLLVEAPKQFVASARVRTTITILVIVAISLAYGVASFRRSADWRDNSTLFIADVRKVPDSALANANAGAKLMNDGLAYLLAAEREGREMTPEERKRARGHADEALVFLRKAVTIHPRHLLSWINIGLCHFQKQEWDEAAGAFANASAIFGRHPMLEQQGANFHTLGQREASHGKFDAASAMFRRAVTTWPYEIRFWRDYAGASFMAMRFAESRAAFDEVLAMAPGDADATRGRRAAEGLEKLERAAKDDPGNPAVLRALARNLRANGHPAFEDRAGMLEMTASMLDDAR